MSEFIEALRFLTILPIKMPFDESALKRSTKFFPLVGLFIGIISLLSFFILSRCFSRDISIFITIFIWEFISGGIHLDGFADTIDGLMSRKNREGILEVMRDSRIGTFGAIGIFFILGIKYLSLSNSNMPNVSLLISPMVGRFLITLSIFLFPYARKEGKGSIFSGTLSRGNLIFVFILTLALSFVIGKIHGLIASFFTLLFGYLFALYLNWRIGGLTGDNYGAICEFTEAVALLVL
ncbi:MAG: adenosylcobinamide-GDP ribazoletransferase [bacterium]|nr:adenosylcobinamide-GDP ribazoletransferase [bacterium]